MNIQGCLIFLLLLQQAVCLYAFAASSKPAHAGLQHISMSSLLADRK